MRVTASVLPERWSVGEATAAVRCDLAAHSLPDGYPMLLGGLVASTALALLVLPCLYLSLTEGAERLGRRLPR